MKNLFKEAHKMTREMVKEYKVNYQVQFGLNLSYLLQNKEEEMKELEGTEKQVKWAESLRESMVKCTENLMKAYGLKFSNMEMNEDTRKQFEEGLNYLEETVLGKLREEEKATWFIDRRDCLGKGSYGLKNFETFDILGAFNIAGNTVECKVIKAIKKHALEEYISLF